MRHITPGQFRRRMFIVVAMCFVVLVAGVISLGFLYAQKVEDQRHLSALSVKTTEQLQRSTDALQAQLDAQKAAGDERAAAIDAAIKQIEAELNANLNRRFDALSKQEAAGQAALLKRLQALLDQKFPPGPPGPAGAPGPAGPTGPSSNCLLLCAK